MSNELFPIYRKLSNGRSFYKILSAEAFEEIQLMGSKRLHHHIKAELYPEKLRIMDMISCTDGLFEPSDQAEWEIILRG